MADFALDAATGLEANDAVLAAGTQVQKQAAFWNIVTTRFINGSRLRLVNEAGVTVTIPMPQGSLQGDTLVWPAFSATAVATGQCDIDVGSWRGFIDNGARFITSMTVPPVGRALPAAIRVAGGSTSPGSAEFQTGNTSVSVGSIKVKLPPLSHFVIPAPPPAAGGLCSMSITAPAQIPINHTLTYTLALGSGTCDAWQTWLINASGDGGAAGDGAIGGQYDSTGGGPGGVYNKDISNISPGTYRIWGRCSSSSGGCLGAWASKQVILLPSDSTTPDPGTGQPGEVPPAILSLPSAPKNWTWTTRSDWGGSGNQIYNISGSFIAESNGMNAAIDQRIGMAYFGLDSGNPNVMRVGIGSAVGNGQVASFRLEANIPDTHPGYDGVRGYPSAGMGQQGGWANQIPDSGTWWDNIPARCDSITSAWAGYKGLNLAGTTCKGHAAHDMRFVTDPRQTGGSTGIDPNSVIAMEWLVQIQHVGGYATHPGGKTPAWYRGAVTLDGVKWHMYLQYGAQTVLFQWIPDRYPAPNWLNLRTMIRYMMTTRFSQLPNGAGSIIRRGADANSFIVEGGHHFLSDVIGFEVCGPGALRMEVDSATLRVNKDPF